MDPAGSGGKSEASLRRSVRDHAVQAARRHPIAEPGIRNQYGGHHLASQGVTRTSHPGGEEIKECFIALVAPLKQPTCKIRQSWLHVDNEASQTCMSTNRE
ncbi:hypothetical protein GCM10007368_30570 [Isoptericola cucumis]|uniref:Uncharacterized protein n=1 Tax=Isoptericola cucumis TaxID=1776856 RepID=A0ABQ2BBD2_9MICO|nr:hypothetical protein GCM10007368_30570 [Isoptericola cucumis]